MRDWTLVAIEGEEVKAPETIEPSAGAKGAAAQKKAPPKADPKKGGLEEITDNRPRTVSHLKDFALEQGGSGLRVTEDIAKRFQEAFLKIEIYSVNRENLEETLKETIKIDLSCLLFPKNNLDVNTLY